MNVVPAPISTMRLGGGIGDAALDRLVDLSPDLRRQRVHRRVVDRQDGDAVFHFVAHEIRHECSRENLGP